MLLPFRSRPQAEVVVPVHSEPVEDRPDALILARQLQQDTSGLGLEAAQLRGTLEDSAAVAERQSGALSQLVAQLHQLYPGASQRSGLAPPAGPRRVPRR